MSKEIEQIKETLTIYKSCIGDAREVAGYRMGKDMKDFFEGGVCALEDALIRLDEVVDHNEKPVKLELVKLEHNPTKEQALDNTQLKLEVSILDMKASGMTDAEIEIEVHFRTKRFLKQLKED